MGRSISTLLILCLVAGQVTATAVRGDDDWPAFRGPTGQGLSTATNLPIEWSATRNVAWKRAVPGTGWSSPVVYRGRVYLTSAVSAEESESKDHALVTLCMDAGTGRDVWSKQIFVQDGASSAPIHEKNSHASPTPLIEGERLYVHFGHQGTACLDLKGKVVWKNRDIRFDPGWGNGGSPIVVDDALIFSCDGRTEQFVIALHKNTGKVLWKTPRPKIKNQLKYSFCTPLLIEIAGRRQVVFPATDVVISYEPQTGKEIWRVRYVGDSIVPRPVFGHGLVFVTTRYHSPSLIAIRPDGKGDVTDTHVEWSTRSGVPGTPSLLLVDSELYMMSDNGLASCLDAKTGHVHWQKRIGGNHSASPVYADGRIYVQSEQGNGVVLAAGHVFKLLAENPIGERTMASYAIVKSAIFLRGEKHLYRIELPGKRERNNR
jgi:outer membrane protein assembly factor BamB